MLFYCVMPDCLPEKHATVPVSIAEVFVDVHVNGYVSGRLRCLTAMFFARCRLRFSLIPAGDVAAVGAFADRWSH